MGLQLPWLLDSEHERGKKGEFKPLTWLKTHFPDTVILLNTVNSFHSDCVFWRKYLKRKQLTKRSVQITDHTCLSFIEVEWPAHRCQDGRITAHFLPQAENHLFLRGHPEPRLLISKQTKNGRIEHAFSSSFFEGCTSKSPLQLLFLSSLKPLIVSLNFQTLWEYSDYSFVVTS